MNKLLVNNKTLPRGAFDLDIRGTKVVHASMYEIKEGTQAYLNTEDITVYFILDNYIYASGSTMLIIRFLNKNSLAHSPTRGVKFISDNQILVLMDSKYRRWSINSADTRTDVGYSPFFGIVTLLNKTSMQSVFFTAKEDNLNASTATSHTHLSDITNTKAFDVDTTKKHVVLGLSRADPNQISNTGSSPAIYSELRTANFCKCLSQCNYAENYNDDIKDYWCSTIESCNGQSYGSTPTHWGWCGRKILGGRIAIWSYNRTTDCPTVAATDTTTACAPLKTLKRDEEVKHIMYDKDKEYIIYTQKNKLHRIDINLENDEILYTHTSNDEITSMAFNNDFSRLTFGTKGGTVKTLKYPSGKLEVTNQYSSGIEVSAIAYAKDVHGTNTCIHHTCDSGLTLNTTATCATTCTNAECCYNALAQLEDDTPT